MHKTTAYLLHQGSRQQSPSCQQSASPSYLHQVNKTSSAFHTYVTKTYSQIPVASTPQNSITSSASTGCSSLSINKFWTSQKQINHRVAGKNITEIIPKFSSCCAWLMDIVSSIPAMTFRNAWQLPNVWICPLNTGHCITYNLPIHHSKDKDKLRRLQFHRSWSRCLEWFATQSTNLTMMNHMTQTFADRQRSNQQSYLLHIQELDEYPQWWHAGTNWQLKTPQSPHNKQHMLWQYWCRWANVCLPAFLIPYTTAHSG